jgi:hypothetical protein
MTTVDVTEHVIDIETDRGIPFRVTVGKRAYRDGTYSPYDVVAFYDRRYEMNSPLHAHGRFVSDYSVETTLERERGYGLNLNGGEPAWTIDAGTMDLVRSWLIHTVIAK